MRTLARALACIVFVGVLPAFPETLNAKQAIQFQQRGQIINGPIILGNHNINVTIDDTDTEVEYEQGAVLKTNPDLEGTLEKAERFREDGNYRVACQLWQAVLKRSGDSLYSSDGSNYFSLVEQVESILATLPPEGLAAYRVLADAEAKEILAEANSKTDEVALNRIVREYFISSQGDEAAFDLGCIYLDRFDFTGARRMFEKILRQYPDPTISLDELLTRIALCQSYLGDIKSARATLAKAEEANPNTDRASMVRDSLGKLTSNVRSSFDSNWLMPMGNAQRYGVTSGVPDDYLDGDLASVFQFYFEPKPKYTRAADTNGIMLTGSKAYGKNVLDTRISAEERLIKMWREKGWRPAGHLLVNNDKVYFKTGTDLSVWDTKKVAEVSRFDSTQSKITSAIAWRSVWSNAFQMDEATRMMQMIRKSYGAFNRRGGMQQANTLPEPTADEEVHLFGDKIFQQMSILNGTLYSIEGKRFSTDGKNKAQVKRVQATWNATYRRTRTNFLTAYDAETGAVLWSLPRDIEQDEDAPIENINVEESEPEWLEGGGFMAAPIAFADMIIVPVNLGGAISVYALDPAQEGKTIWKSFLCDEPESGAVAWSPINLSLDGSDLFVNCGMGVIFVLDPSTGMVRFAKRYKRVGKPDDFQRRNNWTVNRLNFSGWSSDVVIPYGRQMICFSSDNNSIEAFDRNSGKMIWRSEMSPIGHKVDYLLGVYNDTLYAAGSETIIAYDLQGTGRMIWGLEQIFDDKQSFGRGLLTPKGIYMPVEDSIYHFSLKGKEVEGEIVADLKAKVHVELGTEAPVGNLYSDGERFWVHGGNRLYALGPKNAD